VEMVQIHIFGYLLSEIWCISAINSSCFLLPCEVMITECYELNATEVFGASRDHELDKKGNDNYQVLLLFK